MLNDVYIIDTGKVATEEADFNTGFMPLHVIDLNDKEKLLALIEFYYGHSVTQKFGIALKNVNAANAGTLADIMVLLAHPNHLGSVEKMKVFLVDALNDSRKMVEAFLAEQGYHENEVIHLDKASIATQSYFSLYNGQGYIAHCSSRLEFQKLYHAYLQQDYKPDTFLVINEEAHFNDSYAFLQQVENAFNGSNPYLFNLLRALYKSEKQNQYLTSLTALRERQLKTFQKLFEENSKNSEIDYILNFYHKEYEVLPLWFKRLGHIVKAATGKRSWRSLTGSNDT